jgi:hypothetical protein
MNGGSIIFFHQAIPSIEYLLDYDFLTPNPPNPHCL